MGTAGAGVINVPGYSISGEIGRGGMAVVYRARQVLLDREVALKVLNPTLAQDPIHAQRFLQEARMLASLGHPHIVPVYDVGVTPEGLHYFSMQLFTAGDFGKRLREGIDEVELLRVLLAVAQALGFAHARGYVHRDVTPANILFDERNRPVLTDFGIARALAATSRITATGLSVGTSHYMSPEQARGQEVDLRSDIYSLGAVTFEALAGKPPFEGADGFAVAYAHVHEAIPRLPAELANWQAVVDRAMAKLPQDRYEDCAAFIQGLREAAPKEFAQLLKREGPAVVPPVAARAGSKSPAAEEAKPAFRPVAPRPPSRLPLIVAAGTLVLGALTLGGIVLFGGEAATPAPVPRVDGPRGAETAPAQVARLPGAGPAPAAQPARSSSVPAEALQVEDERVVLDAPAQSAPDPSADTGPATLEFPTVEDPVEALLVRGRNALAAQRYTLPAGNNAAEYFRLVQRIEPRNSRAREGLADVAAAYIALANRNDPESATAAWLEHIARAETLARDYQAEAVLEAAAAERRRVTGPWIERGDAALAQWDRERATAEFARVLQVLPEDERARRGLREAKVVGLPGYAFRDAVSGTITPELVIIGRVALGRREVTVAEFRAYWQARGQGRFAPRMPSCRDRENALRFGKRSWDAPGFAQGDRHPVTCVTPAIAEDYLAWISELTGRRYRLPSAKEWRSAGGVAFPLDCAGNIRDASFRAQFGGREGVPCDDGHAATAPSGSFAARSPGLFDLDGNVREWVGDCAAGNCRERLALGASWYSSAGESGEADFPADTAFNTVGFRVLRELD